MDRSTTDLYGTPLEDFTERRNALAKELKAAGQHDEAERVKSLRKPKLSAWAVDQLVRTEAKELEALVAATEEAESAADAASLRELGVRRQRLIRSLSTAAADLLQAHGHAASAGTIQEVVETLQATADSEARAAILRGDLVDPLAPTGFGFATAGLEFEDGADVDPDPKERRRAEEIRSLESKLKDAKKVARDKRLAADRARVQAESAEEDATKAADDAERIEKKLVDLKGASR